MNNPYNAYVNNTVFTASKEELTLMLYEGAIKFINQAKISMESKNIEKTHKLILKTQRIVEELRVTLNTKYEISNQLNEIYEYIESRLVEANIKKETVILDEVNEHLRVLRDTWKEAMRISKSKK